MIELLSCGAFSFAKDAGRENQDAFLLPKVCGDGYVFAIADGVGSYAGAKDAAQIAIKAISSIKLSEVIEPELILDGIKAQITEFVQNAPEKNKAATTLSYCFINEDYLHVIHVGDTRVYVKNGLKLKLLTKDHTQHQELLDDGLYTKKELETLPGKNTLTSAISKSLSVRYQYLKIPTETFVDETGNLMLFIMSDGAHHFWEHRPRFSESTLNNATAFSTNMYKRIKRLGPMDDHSLIAAKFYFSSSN